MKMFAFRMHNFTLNGSKDGQLCKPFIFFLGSAVYTPGDGDNWMLAKLNLQITDLGYAQIVEHLGKVNLTTSFGKIIATCPFQLRPGIE